VPRTERELIGRGAAEGERGGRRESGAAADPHGALARLLVEKTKKKKKKKNRGGPRFIARAPVAGRRQRAGADAQGGGKHRGLRRKGQSAGSFGLVRNPRQAFPRPSPTARQHDN